MQKEQAIILQATVDYAKKGDVVFIADMFEHADGKDTIKGPL